MDIVCDVDIGKVKLRYISCLISTLRKRQFPEGRRTTLIRKHVTSLPIYFMSLFAISRKVGLKLE